MKINKDSLVIITPVYEDVDASNELFKEISKLYKNNIFVVIIDDGSIIHPITHENIQSAGINGVVLKLSRNVGHQKAIAIGLNYVQKNMPESQRIIVMDSDGEDTPHSIKELLIKLDSDSVDIVVAQRKNRMEHLSFKIFYWVYKFIFKLLTGRKISFGNFMAMKPIALKRLTSMSELWIHAAGTVLNSKLRIAFCPLDRGHRYAGKSKMNFVSLALHGFKGLIIFAEDALVRVGIVCSFISIFSVICGFIAILLKIFGFATPGWFSIALGILVLVFLQTGMLALMTLMLTGVVKGRRENIPDFKDYVDTVLDVRE